MAANPAGKEFTLPESVDHYQILVWEADSDYTQHPWTRRVNVRVRLISL